MPIENQFLVNNLSTSNADLEQRPRIKRSVCQDLEATFEMIEFDKSLYGKVIGKKDDDKKLLSINGLLSPLGKLYPCQKGKHANLVESLGYEQIYQLEDKGWINLQQMQWRVETYRTIQPLTRPQVNTIQKWFKKNRLDMRVFYALLEESRQ